MRLSMAVTLSVLQIIFAVNDGFVDLAIRYFKYKNTFSVCMLTCDDLSLNFSKSAFNNNIAVTYVNLITLDGRGSNRIDVCLNQTSPSVGVLIHSKCPSFERVITQASKDILFDSNHKWLILYEINESPADAHIYWKNSTNINLPFLSTIRSLNLSINADIVVAAKEDLGYTIYDVYNFGKIRGGRFVVEIIGHFDTVTGLNLTRRSTLYRRFDFKRMFLNLIIVMSPPPPAFDPQMILNWNSHPSGPIISQTGTIFLHEIAEIHNFRFKYTVVGVWIGDYKKEHNYTVTNGLYFQEQDVTPVLRQLRSHLDKFDVTFPVANIEIKYFYRIPSHGIGKFENQFLKPLSWDTWLCVVGILILCGMVLLLSIIMEERRPISLAYTIFSVLALICQQFFEESEDSRRVSSVRKLTILVTGLSCLLIYNYYTSSVVSWLLNAPPPSINSLWELLDSPLQPVFQDAGYTYSWLELPDYYYNRKYAKAEDELKKRLLNLEKKGKPIFKLVKEGISMVKEGGYVYHGEVEGANKIIGQTFNQRELCDLGSLDSMEKNPVYITVQKNSPYKKFFTWSGLRLAEAGILNRIQVRTLGHVNKCEGSSPRALALGGALPAFILLAAGYLAAIIIMILERYVWKPQMRITK